MEIAQHLLVIPSPNLHTHTQPLTIDRNSNPGHAGQSLRILLYNPPLHPQGSPEHSAPPCEMALRLVRLTDLALDPSAPQGSLPADGVWARLLDASDVEISPPRHVRDLARAAEVPAAGRAKSSGVKPFSPNELGRSRTIESHTDQLVAGGPIHLHETCIPLSQLPRDFHQKILPGHPARLPRQATTWQKNNSASLELM